MNELRTIQEDVEGSSAELSGSGSGGGSQAQKASEVDGLSGVHIEGERERDGEREVDGAGAGTPLTD